MAVIPFYLIDPAMAADDALYLTGSDGSAHLCVESYCVNPSCPCEVVHLFMGELPRGKEVPLPASEALQAMEEIRGVKMPVAAFEFDLGTRKLVALTDSKERGEREGLDLLRDLAPECIAGWIEHRKAALEWGRTNWWRTEDWSDLPLEASLSWRSIRPADPGEVFDRDGIGHLVDDQYCIVPRCPCNEVFLTFFHDTSEERPIGTILASLDKRRLDQVGLCRGSGKEAERIFQEFSRLRPEMVPEYRRRRSVMRDVALVIDGQRKGRIAPFGRPGPTAPAPPASIPAFAGSWVPRNAPCPCGSGKKYKNCCGRGK
jgi:hypothetical protein